VGGARGEVARGTAEETETTVGATSSRFVAGTMAMLGDCVRTTEPAVEQNGQMCDADGAPVRSVQKWNCAPRKMTPRSNARMRMRFVLACMCLLRRSLGRKGCAVKFCSRKSAGSITKGPVTERTPYFWAR
jgi:hypothetical protein